MFSIKTPIFIHSLRTRITYNTTVASVREPLGFVCLVLVILINQFVFHSRLSLENFNTIFFTNVRWQGRLRRNLTNINQTTDLSLSKKRDFK